MLAQIRRRILEDESGVAMVTAMLAIFILTVVVAARALAELRRRIASDFNTNVLRANPLIVQGQCNSNQGWLIIANYGGPGWVDDAANRRAVLAVGTPATPVAVRDAGGNTPGSFFSPIYVRPADNETPPGANPCGVHSNTGIE